MPIKKSIKNNDLIVLLVDKFKEFYLRYFISDEKLLNKRFKQRLGREVNLENPVKFNDKLQWLKLYWDDPLATKCADKYEVRGFIKETVGDKYLNELLGVYESVDEIGIDELPKSFVLKGTHGSGFNIVCKDKNKMDWKKEFKKMKRWLRYNYYWSKREWVYRDIKPRIICEAFLSDDMLNSTSLHDYKFYCFNGIPYYCQVIKGRDNNETIDFFNMNWEHMPFTGMRPLANSKEKIEQPKNYEEMILLARKLSQDFPFVRVDFYYVNNKIYFGELTFFPTSGMGQFYPPEWNRKIGNLLELPKN
ncbi:ATP-grasp fold amidoligase family protein [Lentibacillus salinarum]|uniref:ATP-grasp fold amidoligase family protein n=1 Tax=Lentibacillus salinarum TaxID=446820 RepID=A0ABW3ZVS5_9BACI